MNPNDGKAYSLDDADFRYETVGAALDALDCDGCLIEGEVYFEVDAKPVDLAEYMDAEWLLEDAANRACDEIGDCAEDAFSASKEAIEELDAALKAWVAKHLSGTYWRCVGNSRALKVTAEDVAMLRAKGNGA